MGSVLMIGTIIMILLMTILTTLALIFSIRQKSKLNCSLRNFSILLLCYLLFAFLQYYGQQGTQNIAYMKAMGCLADICYFAFIITWIEILAEFSQKKLVNRNLLYSTVILYGVMAEAFVLMKGHYDPVTWQLVIYDSAPRLILSLLNTIFDSWILFISGYYLILALKNKETVAISSRRAVLFFSSALMLYMIWILILDFDTVYRRGQGISAYITVDPLFVIYSVLGVAVIYLFFKKDPLELLSRQDEKQQHQQLETTIAQNQLTPREAQVLELVCRGLNNPDIAATLSISENTVKRHLNNIFRKTGNKNRYELISFVYRR